jgi:hypothetical protein
MSDCEKLQDRALEDGADAATATPELREHLARCPHCQRFLDDLQKLSGALQALPAVDAPDSLVDNAAQRIHKSPAQGPRPIQRWWRSRYWLSAAASFVVVGFIYLLTQPAYQTYSPRAKEAERSLRQYELTRELAEELQLSDGLLADLSDSQSEQEFLGEAKLVARMRSGADASGDRSAPRKDKKKNMKKGVLEGSEQLLDELATSGLAGAGTYSDERRNRELDSLKEDRGRGDDNAALVQKGAIRPETSQPQSEVELGLYRKSEIASPSPIVGNELPAEPVAQSKAIADADTEHASEENLPAAGKRAARQPAARDLTVAGRVSDSLAEREADDQRGQAIAKAEYFLAELENVEGLTFKEPSGYYRNTYVPGDSAMRLLRMRMSLWHSLPELSDVRLSDAVRANRQPLDVPDNAAMGLYLQADKAAVPGAARLRVQIGLKGAERKGVRPTMNVSVMVDLSAAAQQPSEQQVRAVVTALASARQPGDRFSLSVAGKDGGLLVESGDFRHGPLQVALARMFGDDTPVDARAVNLADAIQIAADEARSGDDPSAVFGSSLVLLVTHGVTEAQLPALQDIAHRNAVGGIALSVIDTRNSSVLGADASVLERLVAAGQGQRRSMTDADDAARVINAELHAASQAVARAARLRIRLAPGVQLLDVLGSQRLDEPQAERVREAEQSIDRRLSRNLSIRADRGEDEDGIQIVIPNFHAGDSHVILLDVLVEGPGAIADVTLRYKDLVHLKNGVARAELRLPAGDRLPGPLQRNVLKNRVAFEMAQAARTASRFLEQEDMPRAIGTLQSMHDLFVWLRDTVSGWSSDRELLADASAVADYVAYLQNHTPTHPFIHRYAIESLRYMALRKLTAADEDTQR